jgi:hypothetical protein
MVQRIIDPKLAIWIVNYSLHNLFPCTWKAEGFALDGYHGFGDSITRKYKGELVLISLYDREFKYLSLSKAHFSREGFKWLIQGTEHLPETPFLISSDLGLQIIFNGFVKIDAKQEVIDLSEPEKWVYSVSSISWFGVMTVHENERVNLVAFSSKQGVEVSIGDKLWSFEWDCSAGEIQDILTPDFSRVRKNDLD